MSPTKKPPAWLADRNPTSDRARLQDCPKCKRPVIRALVGGRLAALDTRADPQPLDLAGELTARLAGRSTFCLSIRPHLVPRLLERHRWHIAAGTCTHIVVALHNCPNRQPQPVQESLL
jgi:hypothetical protein